MKRSLLVASCVLLVSGLLSSCQKEDKDIVQLAQELTAELQQIKDPASANARAERVAALNKRFQDASARVAALNSTSLVRGADADDDHRGASYAAALKSLAVEVGRVRASFPGSDEGDGVDRERLLVTIGAVAGEKTAADRKAYGENYLQDEAPGHETPGNFPEYYGSEKLRDALAYRTNLSTFSNMKFDSAEDVPAIPAVSEAAADAADEAKAEDDSAAASDDTEPAAGDTEPAADETDDTSSDDTSADDTSSDDTSSDDDSSSSSDDDDSSDDDSSSSSDDDSSVEDISIELDL